jgi:cytochrome b561
LSIEAGPERWSGPIIWLHWIGAATIIALIAIGWAMIYGGLDAAETFDLYQQHKSFGFVALVLTAARLAARFAGSAPPPPPSPLWERRLAAFAQGSLYVLTVCAIVSGWLVVSTSPLPVPTRFFDLFVIPNIAPPDPSTYAAAALAHKLTAWAVAVLVALHVAGALKHHFVNRDDVLMRMLPNRPKLGSARR